MFLWTVITVVLVMWNLWQIIAGESMKQSFPSLLGWLIFSYLLNFIVPLCQNCVE